jgi:2-aminoadipate transaminase
MNHAPRSIWTLARRTERLRPSSIREILKLTERSGVVSLAGGLPSPQVFPVEAVAEATARVLRDQPREALQYAPTEGFGPLREWIAADLATGGWMVPPSQVLITTGSQQALDLLGKVLVDPGSAVGVEAPTYLGALQAFAPYEPAWVTLACDAQGPLPDALATPSAGGTLRLAYLQPNFQNPSGRLMPGARRRALVDQALRLGVPLVEDNPYGELWFDAPPAPPLAALAGEGAVYLGSFSKVLAPGLRLGYLVAPPHLHARLVQAKQAADLHTSGFNQRVAFETVRDGLLQRHLPAVRARYKAQRDALIAALETELRPLGCDWTVPAGGMFCWVSLPGGLDADECLPHAVAAGVAFVPGSSFFVDGGGQGMMRLSFATAPAARMADAVRALAGVIRLAPSRHPTGMAP